MAQEHTPGPWEVRRAMIGHTGRVAVAAGGCFDWVCSMQTSNCPNWQADARLIAAAPTQHTALVDVAERLGDHLTCFCETGFICEPCAVMSEVRKAIALATKEI